jgi:hypothetical protein
MVPARSQPKGDTPDDELANGACAPGTRSFDGVALRDFQPTYMKISGIGTSKPMSVGRKALPLENDRRRRARDVH